MKPIYLLICAHAARILYRPRGGSDRPLDRSGLKRGQWTGDGVALKQASDGGLSG